jgi:hypothetical protein
MVGARGFEPPASRTRTVRSTKLSYAPSICFGGPGATDGRRTSATLSGKRRAGGRDYLRPRRPVKMNLH